MKLRRLAIWAMLLPLVVVAERFTLNSSVVIDSKTALEWQSKPTTSKYTHIEAIEHCSDLEYGGYSDWRLPNLYELKSLVDYDRYNPAIAIANIEIKTDDWYWTASEYKNDSSSAWVVPFKNGRDYWNDKSY